MPTRITLVRCVHVSDLFLPEKHAYEQSTSIVPELTGIAGVHCTNLVPPMFTPAKDRRCRTTQLDTAKPSQARPTRLSSTTVDSGFTVQVPVLRWELSIVPPRLIIYSNRPDWTAYT
jgi:hypothetical protein